MKNSRLIFMTIIGFSTGLVAQGAAPQEAGILNTIKDKATSVGDFIGKSMVAGLAERNDRQSTKGLVQAAIVEFPKILSDGIDTIGVKALEAKDAAVELKNAVEDKAQYLSKLYAPAQIEKNIEKSTKANETSSSSASVKESDKTPVKAAGIKVDGEKSFASMYERIVNNPISTVMITAAVATILGVSYYVYIQYGVDKDAEIENN